MLDGNPASYWTAENGTAAPWVEIDLGTEALFNRSMLQEHVALGQRIEEYVLEAWDQGGWRTLVKGTTVGYKKLDRFPEVKTARVRLTIGASRGFPTISEFGLFQEPPIGK